VEVGAFHSDSYDLSSGLFTSQIFISVNSGFTYWMANNKYGFDFVDITGSTGSSGWSQSMLNQMTVSLNVAVKLGNSGSSSVDWLPLRVTYVNVPSVTVTETPGWLSTSTLTVYTSSSTPPQIYTITVNGASGSLGQTTSFNLNIGSFSISANPTSLTIPAGGTGTSQIKVTSQGSFSGTVSLTADDTYGPWIAQANPGCAGGYSYYSCPNSIISSSSTPFTFYAVLGEDNDLLASSPVGCNVSPGGQIQAPPLPTNCVLLLGQWNTSPNWPQCFSLSRNPPYCHAVFETYWSNGAGLGNGVMQALTGANNICGTPFCYKFSYTFANGLTGYNGNWIIFTVEGFDALSNVFEQGFFAQVTGSTTTPATPSVPYTGPTVTLSSTSLSLSAGQTATTTLTVTTYSSTAVGNYPFSIFGASGMINTTSTINVYDPQPDFSISANPTSTTSLAGTTTSSTITVSSLYNFAGVVSLTQTVSSSGLTCSMNPATVTLGSSVPSTLSCNGSEGVYSVTVTGTSGSLKHSVPITFTVQGFSMNPDSSTVTILPGATSTSNIAVSALNAFQGTVNLVQSSTPTGLSCTLNPISASLTTTTITGTSTMHCSGPVGSYKVTINGASGSLSHQTSITLNIADFNISATASITTVLAGSQTSSTITITPLGGFTSTVTLSFNVSSSGLTCSLNPSNITSPGTSSLSCGGSIGKYRVTITGVSGTLTHSTIVGVTVQDFTISVGPQNVIPGTATIPVTITSINGFSGNVSLSSCCLTSNDGLPGSGITFSFNPSTVTPTPNGTITSMMTVTVAQNVNVESLSYTVEIMGTSNGVTRGFAKSIFPADFWPTASPTSLILQSGASGTSTITISSLRFYGTVYLSAYSTNYLVSPSLRPSQLNLVWGYTNTSILTISAAYATAGNYTITAWVQSGYLSHFVTITVQVKDFSLTVSPWSVTIPAGRSGSTTVNLTSLNGFRGTVSLSPTSLPSCVTASFSPSQLTLKQGGTNSSTLTLTLSASCHTNTATYMYVVATSGPTYHNAYVGLTVGDYQVSETPSPVGITIGGSGSVNMTAIGSNGYPATPAAGPSSELSMTVSGLPSGVGYSFTGATSVTVSGQSINDTVVQRAFGLTFDQPLPFNFWTALPGSSIGTSYNGVFSFSQSYILLSGSHTLEVGVSAWVGYWRISVYVNGALVGQAIVNINTHVKVSLTAINSATLNLSVSNKSTPGRYSINVTATDGVVSRSTIFDLRIGSFAISVSPDPTVGGISATTTTTVNISPFYGSTNTVLLSASLPTCVSSYSFSPGSISFPAGGTSTLTIVTGSTCKPGSYTGTVTATGKSTSNSTSFTFNILNFTMTASAYYVSTPQGTATGDSITVGVTGVSSTVNLSATISPSTGVWTSIFYPTLQVSSGGTAVTGMQIAAQCNAAPGNYTVTVTGQIASTLSKSVVITFNVTPGCTGGGGGGSVAAGTLITLADGTQVPVQNLQVGMQLLSYNMTTRQYVTITITRFVSVQTDNLMIIHTATGKPLIVDQNPAQKLEVMFPNGTYTELSVTRLQVGDYLFDATTQTWVPVTAIQYVNSGVHTMYDIYTNAPTLNYVANDYLDYVKV
jgi:hypothetical protein